MYQSIWELPTPVLNSLNEEDATKWMTAYNECNPKSKDEITEAKKKAWRSVEKAPSSFSFRIIASTDTVDKAREIIDLESIKKHMDSFIEYGGNIQNDHHNYTVGTIWDWKPCKVKDDRGKEVDGILTYGNIYGGDFVYDKIRESFVKGMNSLSVAGEALPGRYQCDEKGCYTRRKVQQLMEISLCVEPMNKYCTLVDYNKGAGFAKSDSAMNLMIREYTIHKDSSSCPVMSLKKSLTAIGYNAHAREDGVHIPMTFLEFIDDEDNFRSHGLNIDYNGRLGEAVVTRRFFKAKEDHLQNFSSQQIPKRYLHLGHTEFDPSIIKIDEPYGVVGKPRDILYASEFWPNGKNGVGRYYSPWDEYSDDWCGGNYENDDGLKCGFTFELAPTARVLRINNYNDFSNIPPQYWDDASKDKYFLDRINNPLKLNYQRLMKDYDAIDFSDEFGEWTGMNGYNIGDEKYLAPILDTGTLMVFNPNVVSNIQSWIEPRIQENAVKNNGGQKAIRKKR